MSCMTFVNLSSVHLICFTLNLGANHCPQFKAKTKLCSRTDNRNTGAYVSLRGVWRTLRENIICFPRKFFGTSHFPVTRKTLVTKDSPNDGSSNVFRVIINLFRCQNHDKYGIYGISFLLKHIFLVWLNFGEKKMAVTATEHWQQCGKVFSKTVTKGKLKNKSYCFQNKCFYWYFLHCPCLISKHQTLLNYTVLLFL